ncbi:hypothetical protein MC885_001028 [Smutsia gigantea]|nr:hypothetical protein MC885_001028 [Smutsia gigantea]
MKKRQGKRHIMKKQKIQLGLELVFLIHRRCARHCDGRRKEMLRRERWLPGTPRGTPRRAQGQC